MALCEKVLVKQTKVILRNLNLLVHILATWSTTSTVTEFAERFWERLRIKLGQPMATFFHIVFKGAHWVVVARDIRIESYWV